MKLNALQLVNFRQHADTRIEFDLGLTGIIGPNGAGKTTILEAIAWALYGQPAARGTRDSIRFSRAGPRTSVRVELDFELAGHQYRVVRGLTSAELYLDGGAEPIASSITGVAELLQRRLGMTRAEFFHTYFTGQKELNVMAAMAPAERAQFLSRVLGYDRLRTAQTLVRERRKLILAEIAGLKSVLPDAENVARQHEEARLKLVEATRRRHDAEQRRQIVVAEFAVLAPRWEAAQLARDAVQQLLGELRVAQNDEAARSRDLDRVERDVREIGDAREELQQIAERIAPLSEHVAEFHRLEDLAREEGRRQTLVETENALLAELSALRARLEKLGRAPDQQEQVLEQLERKRAELEEVMGFLEARRTEWVRDRQEAETKREALRRQWGELKAQRDQIVDLGEEGVCPTCTRVLGANFRTVLDQLEEQLETIEVDGRYFATRLEQLAEMPDDVKALDAQRRTLAQEVTALERELANVQASMQELKRATIELATKEQRQEAVRRDLNAIPTGYDPERHAALEEEMAKLAPLNERATRLSALVDREPALKSERDRSWKELEHARGRALELRERHEATRFSEEEHARLRAQYESAATAARGGEAAMVAALGEEAMARDGVTHAERSRQEMERARQAHARLESEKRMHDELDRFYTDLRTDLNVKLRPELSDLASGFLETLTDGRYSELQLDDQYNVVVLEDRVPKTVISGGEEDLTHLVLRLAISQMIAERAGQAFSLLVLDEVFGSLDDARRHGVVQLLRRLQDRFEQVILITHIESVRDELDRVILVEYDEETGASRVRQAEPEYPSELVTAGGLFDDSDPIRADDAPEPRLTSGGSRSHESLSPSAEP